MLSASSTYQYFHDLFANQHRLLFLRASVRKDQIYVRAQSWIAIPENNSFIVPEMHCGWMCAHLNGEYCHRENPYSMVFRCRKKHLIQKQDSCEECRSLIRCRSCPTKEFLKESVPMRILKTVFCLLPSGRFLVTGCLLQRRIGKPTKRNHAKLHDHTFEMWDRKYSF